MKKWTYLWLPLLALAVGFLASSLTRQGMETIYPMWVKPALTPPNIVFPIVWTGLYILMGLGLAMVLQQGGAAAKPAAIVWGVQLALNFVWTLVFFGAGKPLAALLILVLLWLAILIMIRSFRQFSTLAAVLQVPYLLWVTFAGYLNLAIFYLNR
ncbi:TspO/MBR family protein [Candidatus Avoscillospira sp. LCP25S3_F1]|uniref:TspO/MBR family protein n=1 Tax=Candidatus Avoscillospira sp. LCP25S3_F1 TaxID=3438825 RepID=UPI003F912DB1